VDFLYILGEDETRRSEGTRENERTKKLLQTGCEGISTSRDGHELKKNRSNLFTCDIQGGLALGEKNAGVGKSEKLDSKFQRVG